MGLHFHRPAAIALPRCRMNRHKLLASSAKHALSLLIREKFVNSFPNR
jgi:hypothetical protein